MDKKDLNINNSPFPEPSVSVDDAWSQMNAMLPGIPNGKPTHLVKHLFRPSNIIYILLGIVAFLVIVKKTNRKLMHPSVTKNIKADNQLKQINGYDTLIKPLQSRENQKDTTLNLQLPVTDNLSNASTQNLGSLNNRSITTRLADPKFNISADNNSITAQSNQHEDKQDFMMLPSSNVKKRRFITNYIYSPTIKYQSKYGMANSSRSTSLYLTPSNLTFNTKDMYRKKQRLQSFITDLKQKNPFPKTELSFNDHNFISPVLDTSNTAGQIANTDVQKLKLTDSINILINYNKSKAHSIKIPAFQVGLQFQSPLLFFKKEYYLNHNGKYSPGLSLIPQLVLKYNLNQNSFLYTSINLLTNNYAGDKTMYSEKVRRSPTDTFSIENATSLINVTGKSITLGYSYNLSSKTGLIVGFNYNLFKGALVHYTSKDLKFGTIMQDSMAAITRTDTPWKYISKGTFNIQTEINYSFKKWSLGFQFAIPITSITSSSSNPIRKPSYSLALRYWINRYKK